MMNETLKPRQYKLNDEVKQNYRQLVTYFKSINALILNEWLNTLDSNQSTKEDKAPMLLELQNKRLALSFNPNRNPEKLVTSMRRLCLRYLWSVFLLTQKLCINGEQSTLSKLKFLASKLGKYVKAEKNIIDKGWKASQFEWKRESTLIFLHWKCFQREALDRFEMFIFQDNLRDTS